MSTRRISAAAGWLALAMLIVSSALPARSEPLYRRRCLPGAALLILDGHAVEEAEARCPEHDATSLRVPAGPR